MASENVRSVLIFAVFAGLFLSGITILSYGGVALTAVDYFRSGAANASTIQNMSISLNQALPDNSPITTIYYYFPVAVAYCDFIAMVALIILEYSIRKERLKQR